jgi:hypothetical protein
LDTGSTIKLVDFRPCNPDFFLALSASNKQSYRRLQEALLSQRTFIAFALLLTGQVFAADLLITGISKPFFNPSLGQKVAVTVAVPVAGHLRAQILDRDGYPVRALCDESVRVGERLLHWDGKDERGMVVPDEAYSMKVDLIAGGRHMIYFPASLRETPAKTLSVRWYDRTSGVISYDLPVASRVHLQAGSAVKDASGHMDGPVLKTVVDEQPRIAGAIIEQWSGFDESGTIFVADQPNFVMSLVAAPLPENSIITVGNRTTTFLAYAGSRKGTSLLAHHEHGEHHAGLLAIDDVAPELKLTAKNAQLIAELQGSLSARFAKRSDSVLLFVDGQRVATESSSVPQITFALPSLSRGPHVVAVNWVGRNGPVAVNALRITNPPTLAQR